MVFIFPRKGVPTGKFILYPSFIWPWLDLKMTLDCSIWFCHHPKLILECMFKKILEILEIALLSAFLSAILRVVPQQNEIKFSELYLKEAKMFCYTTNARWR